MSDRLTEIEAELEEIKLRNLDEVNEALNKTDAVIVDKLEHGTAAEQWLAKQYKGHLMLIYQWSTINPLPVEPSFTALDGNVQIATIIQSLGWPEADCFRLVADDMMRSFQDVVKLKAEAQAIQDATEKRVTLSDGPTSTVTFH